jgi:hypothetical protein
VATRGRGGAGDASVSTPSISARLGHGAV